MTIKTAGTKLVLFDLDGTLTDPGEGIANSLRNGLELVGIDPSEHQPLQQFIGPPLQESFVLMGVPETELDKAIVGYREHFADIGIFENFVYPGIPEMLAHLVGDGWTLAIATSKPETFARRILDHFDLAQFFDVVAGATLDGSRRHKSDVIQHALDQLPQRLEESTHFMVGDRNVDIEGGRLHGLDTIAVTWGYGSLSELESCSPSSIVEEPSQVLAILDAGLS